MSTETHVTIDAFRVLGFNFIISFLGAWGVHDVTYKDTIAGGVKVRIYEPKHKPGDKMAAIIYLHGGGWVYGSPGKQNMNDFFARPIHPLHGSPLAGRALN